jgi:hypothetical protein
MRKAFRVFLCALPAFLVSALVSDWLNAPWLGIVLMFVIMVGVYRAMYHEP